MHKTQDGRSWFGDHQQVETESIFKPGKKDEEDEISFDKEVDFHH